MKNEIRVYLISKDNLDGDNGIFLTNAGFIALAELQGTVYTLAGFTNAYNAGEVDAQNTIIKFI